ncbi:Calcium homeostasis modulator protein-like protein [Aphelenchoides fujianensis]|nr:Calcium homeostasis modulator protein-like protein [Aphelenchoides fujianensis]
MLGVLLNQKTWRLVHGCCYRARASQHPLSTSLLYWLQIVGQALIAPIAWLFVSLLDGSYFRCLMAARFCSNVSACAGSVNMQVCEPCVCNMTKVDSDKLISESQFLAWVLLVGTGISACLVTCCVRIFDKYRTYTQDRYVEMYREIEEKIFEECAKEDATNNAKRNSERFFKARRINKDDWDVISSLPKVENPYVLPQLGWGKVNASGEHWQYTTLQKWCANNPNPEDTQCGIEVESAT